jgi:hypothetical protein
MKKDSDGSRDCPALSDARNQLNLVLGFFPRVDGKQSVLLGIHLAMLGYLASRAPIPSAETWPGWAASGLFLIITVISLWKLYQGSFPNLGGGEHSLVFFRAIAGLREIDFVERYQGSSDEALVKEILCQVWRNSTILHEKFQKLKTASLLMAASTVPWLVAIILFQVESPTILIGAH